MDRLNEYLNSQPRNGDDPLLTATAAAKRIGVSTETVRRWIKSGDVLSEPVGPKRRKVRASVVERIAPRSTRNNYPQDTQNGQNGRTTP
jgi:excisionase family DNA binding protein